MLSEYPGSAASRVCITRQGAHGKRGVLLDIWVAPGHMSTSWFPPNHAPVGCEFRVECSEGTEVVLGFQVDRIVLFEEWRGSKLVHSSTTVLPPLVGDGECHREEEDFE